MKRWILDLIARRFCQLLTAGPRVCIPTHGATGGTMASVWMPRDSRRHPIGRRDHRANRVARLMYPVFSAHIAMRHNPPGPARGGTLQFTGRCPILPFRSSTCCRPKAWSISLRHSIGWHAFPLLSAALCKLTEHIASVAEGTGCELSRLPIRPINGKLIRGPSRGRNSLLGRSIHVKSSPGQAPGVDVVPVFANIRQAPRLRRALESRRATRLLASRVEGGGSGRASRSSRRPE